MRSLSGLLAAALIALAVPGQAQEDACTETDPCLWVVNVDADGFTSEEGGSLELAGTSGDWFRLDGANFDDVEHALTLDEYAVTLDLAALGDEGSEAQSEVFQLLEAGEYVLADDPSGDVATVRVTEGDVVEEETGAEGTGDGTGTRTASKKEPGPAVFLTAASLLGVAFLARRRL